MSSAKDALLLAKLKAKTDKAIRDVETPSLSANVGGELPVATTTNMKPLPVATTNALGASDILKSAKIKDMPQMKAKSGQIGADIPTARTPYSPVSEFLKKRK